MFVEYFLPAVNPLNTVRFEMTSPALQHADLTGQNLCVSPRETVPLQLDLDGLQARDRIGSVLLPTLAAVFHQHSPVHTSSSFPAAALIL